MNMRFECSRAKGQGSARETATARRPDAFAPPPATPYAANGSPSPGACASSTSIPPRAIAATVFTAWPPRARGSGSGSGKT